MSYQDVDTTSENFIGLTNDPNECKRKLEIYREISVDGMGKSVIIECIIRMVIFNPEIYLMI